MITEDYCSFEVAKLLKEKGFLKDVDLRMTQNLSFYNNIGLSHNLNKWYDSLIQDKIDFVVAPTHQMAMKWLRKEHNILLFLLPAQENGKLVYLVEVWTWNEEEGIYESTYAPMPRKEPEQAIELALKYSLENLI